MSVKKEVDGLFSKVSGDHSYQEILDGLSGALTAVEGRINVSPSARVRLWLTEIARLSDADKRSVLLDMIPTLSQGRFDHPFQDAFRALVDSRMFVEIIDHLLPLLEDRDLGDLVSGNLQPGDDDPSSRARDREFELFIAAVCSRGGLKVELEEPDIRVHVDGRPFVIAAKRLRSLRKVRKNLRKAASQIVSSGHPGFIFADATQILDLAGVVVTHWTDANKTVGEPLNHFTERSHHAILRANRGELVRGVVLRVGFPLISEGFRFGTYERWSVVACRNQDPVEVNRTVAEFLRGLQGL